LFSSLHASFRFPFLGCRSHQAAHDSRARLTAGFELLDWTRPKFGGPRAENPA
jgi:hypothetical protein